MYLIIIRRFFFTLMQVLPVMVLANNTINNDSTFQCRYVHGLFVDEQSNDSSCPPYDCWNSQLLDLSRDSLVTIFNDYKASIAQKKCEKCAYPGILDFGLVFQMYYSWVLERLTIHYQRVHDKACEFQHRASITIDDFPDVMDVSFQSDENIYELEKSNMEYSSTSFKLDYGDDQTCAIERFKVLMYRDRKYNLFEAWDGTKYRYALVTAFGCVMTIRDNVTGSTAVNETVSKARVAFLACVFANRRTQNDNDNPENCTGYNAMTDPRTKLCFYADLQENTADDIPCQFYYNIKNGALFPGCGHQPPRVWLKNEAPNPRHRKIEIRISYSHIIELDLETGLIRMLQKERNGNPNVNEYDDDDDDDDTEVEEPENLIEYDDELIELYEEMKSSTRSLSEVIIRMSQTTGKNAERGTSETPCRSDCNFKSNSALEFSPTSEKIDPNNATFLKIVTKSSTQIYTPFRVNFKVIKDRANRFEIMMKENNSTRILTVADGAYSLQYSRTRSINYILVLILLVMMIRLVRLFGALKL